MTLESLPQRGDTVANSQSENSTASTLSSDSSCLPRASILKPSGRASSAASGTSERSRAQSNPLRVRFNVPLPINTFGAVNEASPRLASPMAYVPTTTLPAMSYSASPVAEIQRAALPAMDNDANSEGFSTDPKSPTIPTTPTDVKSPNVEERAKKLEAVIVKTLLAPAITQAFEALRINRHGKHVYHHDFEIKPAMERLKVASKEGIEEEVKIEEINVFRSLSNLERAENVMHDVWEKKLLENCREAVRTMIETML